MSAAASTTALPERKPLSRVQSIAIMFACTVLGAAGQLLIKMGANGSNVHVPWTSVAGIWQNLFAMASNVHLVSGYSLYGVMMVLFVVALRDQDLSVVYPVIALTYVWVAMLSVYFFHEAMNLSKLVGIIVIVAGVGVLSRDVRK